MSSPPHPLPSYLLDVNVLIALGVRQRQFHTRVAAWVAARQFSSQLTCPVTELGFVRIVAQTPSYAASVEQSLAQLAGLKSTSKYSIRFIADDQDVSQLPAWVKAGKQTTDGHLLQLAYSEGALLATLDTRFPGEFELP